MVGQVTHIITVFEGDSKRQGIKGCCLSAMNRTKVVSAGQRKRKNNSEGKAIESKSGGLIHRPCRALEHHRLRSFNASLFNKKLAALQGAGVLLTVRVILKIKWLPMM